MRYLTIFLACLLIGCNDMDQINKQSFLICALGKRVRMLEAKVRVKVDKEDTFTCNGYDKPLK